LRSSEERLIGALTGLVGAAFGALTQRHPILTEQSMYVIAQFTIIPIGAGTSLSGYVAACERVLAATGLTYELHANGTNLEGEWEAVIAAIKRCHDTLHGMGVPRISTVFTLGTRTDRPQRMADKLLSVQAKLVDQD
jgi:uncharacterized protein (TIGR00106 family)